MSLLALAARPDAAGQRRSRWSPARSTSRRCALVAPLRPIADVTSGCWARALYRALGGAPAPLVKRALPADARFDKYLTKPLAILLATSHDREFLAQIEAVDHFMDQHARLPGAHDGPALPPLLPRQRPRRRHARRSATATIDLADVTRARCWRSPGESDVLAPRAAVHHVGALLPGAPEVRLDDRARRPPRGAHGPRRGGARRGAARRVPRPTRRRARRPAHARRRAARLRGVRAATLAPCRTRRSCPVPLLAARRAAVALAARRRPGAAAPDPRHRAPASPPAASTCRA